MIPLYGVCPFGPVGLYDPQVTNHQVTLIGENSLSDPGYGWSLRPQRPLHGLTIRDPDGLIFMTQKTPL